jgi:hypothetical protein
VWDVVASDAASDTPAIDALPDDDAWVDGLPARPEDLAEATRIEDHCLLEDLDFMRAPLFRIVGAPSERVPLRVVLPGARRMVPARRTVVVAGASLALGSRAVAGFRCVYVVDSRGALQAGFVPVSRTERVADPPPSSPGALVGDWFEGACGTANCGSDCPADHVRIGSVAGQPLRLTGEATWRCGLHLGSYDGSVVVRNGRGVALDPEMGCEIHFVERGPFLMFSDNERCGGANVRFVGIYVRSPRPLRFTR